MSTIETFTGSFKGRHRTLANSRSLFVDLVGAVRAASVWLGSCSERFRSRIALEELSDHQLKDIGISRADAYRESHRPFWDGSNLPGSRRRED